jgi:hypothetical protein
MSAPYAISADQIVRVPPAVAALADGLQLILGISRRDRDAVASGQDGHGQAQQDRSAPRHGGHPANQLTGHVAEPTLTATGCLRAHSAFRPKWMSRPRDEQGGYVGPGPAAVGPRAGRRFGAGWEHQHHDGGRAMRPTYASPHHVTIPHASQRRTMARNQAPIVARISMISLPSSNGMSGLPRRPPGR